MVSFSCNKCDDVVTKGKVANHSRSCGSYHFCCVDCMQVFDLDTIKPHTSCISEVAKYQGKFAALPNGNPVKRPRVPDSDDDEPVKPVAQKKRVVPTFSDSDDDDWVQTKPVKRASSPKHSPVSAPAAAPSRLAPPCVVISDGTSTSSDITVASFVLGSADVVAEIARNVLDEAHSSSMDIKELSKRVVNRFQARLAKQLRGSVEEAIAKAGSRHGVRQTSSNVHI